MNSPSLARSGRFFLSLSSLAVAASGAVAQTTPKNPQEPRNLVLNGSFENPPVDASTARELVSAGAWTADVGTIEIQNASGATAYFGTQYMALDSLSVVSQLCNTQVGRAYSLSFAFAARTGAPEVRFEVWYAGTLKETIVVPSGSSTAWTHKNYLVTGVSTRDKLEFRCLTGGPLGVLIDDCYLMSFSSTPGQILRNPNFEDDPRLGPGEMIETPVYVGWLTGFHYDILMHDLGNAGDGVSGDNVMHVREKRNIFQRVYVVPGQTYQLTLAFSPSPSDDRARSFTVSFDGQLLETVAVPLSPTIGWTVRTYQVTPRKPLTSLDFKDLSDGSEGCMLDAVSLTGPVPDPETDGQLSSFRQFAQGGGIQLAQEAMFARGMTSLGDLDRDGVQDLAIGAVGDDDGGDNTGAVWIAFLNANRTVKASSKISELRGGLVADLQDNDGFGRALSAIGDLDGDGITDLAVGANEDDTADHNAGAVYVLFMTRQGTVRAQHKITALSGDALDYVPVFESNFGAAIAGMGDVDGDGIPDIAIGSRFGDSVQTCFMRRDGTVRASKNITYGINGFTDTVTSVSDFFGMSVGNMGDFDNDGVNDLLVGAFGRRIFFQNYVGGQYLMLLRPDGTVKQWFYYGTENMNPRTQTLGVNYNLGTSCAGLGDVDGDGVRDLATGAQREGPIDGLEREESTNQGAVYVLLLNSNGTIKTCQRISERAGGFNTTITNGARWGESLAPLGDFDGDGLTDVAIGSRFVNGTGAVYMSELVGRGAVPLRADFTGSPVTGQAPLTVQFTDRSTGTLVSWFWEFGDGTTSTLASPSHVYSSIGTFSVTLTVRDASGVSNSKAASNLVTVQPNNGLPNGVAKLGCGINPPTSIRILSGVPRIGTTMTFGIDNPFGTQRPGSTPLLVASWTARPQVPCGSLQARRGMSSATAPGELLVSNPLFFTRRGTPWTGAGNPAPVTFAIPNTLSFVGMTLFVQGRLQDRSAGAPIPLSFADGFALTFQP